MSDYQPKYRRPIASILRSTAHVAVRWCIAWRITPNMVSYASIVASVGAAVCFGVSSELPWLLVPAAGLCYLRLWFNMLDGMVALASGQASKTGEIANELPDRVSDILIFTGVAHSGWCEPLGGYWVAILALLVAYVGTLGQAIGVQREFSGIMSKPWRMVALHLGAWLALAGEWLGHPRAYIGRWMVLDITHALIVAGCVQTIVIRLLRIIRAIHALDRKEKSK